MADYTAESFAIGGGYAAAQDYPTRPDAGQGENMTIGSAPMTKYLMEATDALGVRVSWLVTSTPDWNGTSYAGAGTLPLSTIFVAGIIPPTL